MKSKYKTIKTLLLVCCLSLLLTFTLTACQRCEHQYDGPCDTSCNLCEKTRPAEEHTFVPATCTTPATCLGCGATEGQPLEHNWEDATCLAPKTCPDCKATEGVPLEHDDTNGDYVCDNGCNQPTLTKETLQTIIDNTLNLSNVFVHQQTYGALDDYYYITNNFVYQHLDGDSPRYFYNEQDVTYALIQTGEGYVKEQIQETVLFQLSYLFEGKVDTNVTSNVVNKEPTSGLLADKIVFAFANSSNVHTGFVLNESGTLLDGIVVYDENGNYVIEYAFTIVEEGSEPNEQIAQIAQSFEHALDCAIDLHEWDQYTYDIDSTYTNAYKLAVCKHCGRSYITEDVSTTYQNGHAVATFVGDDQQSWSLTDGTQLSATELQNAILYMLDNGETNIDLTLPAEADIDKLVAIRNALLYVNKGGVIDLTLRGITEIPFYLDDRDEGIFGTWYVGEMPVTVDSLKSVTLTDATLIELRSFDGAYNLTSVSAPLVTEVGDGAFANTKLAQVYLPLTKIIGAYAFDCCPLAEISLPSAEEIRYCAFNYCAMLSKAYLPNVTTIGYNAFYRCDMLEEITFGNLQFVDHSAYGIFCDTDLVMGTLNVTIPCNQSVLTLGEDNCWRATEGLYRETADYQNNMFMGYTFKSVNFSHQAEYAINNDDGTHSFTCTICGVTGTENHTLTYTANGNVITEACSADCGYSETATIIARDATYDGLVHNTAIVDYSEGWKGGELTISYANNTNAGTATASITVGEVTATVDFTIAKAPLTVTADAKIKSYGDENPPLTYTAEGLLGGDTLASALTGALSREEGENAGSYAITLGTLSADNYTISFEGADFTIQAKEVTNPTVTLEQDSYQYDGTAKEPKVISVVVDGCTLTADTDYTISYENNIYVGNYATVVINFTGNYDGTFRRWFTITQDTKTAEFDGECVGNGELPDGHVSQIANGSTDYDLSLPMHVYQSVPETETPAVEFVGQQLDIGGGISMKFYVRNNEDRPIESITVEVEFLGKLTYLTQCERHPTDAKVYIYTFEGITPQCLGDAMNVVILVGGSPVGNEKAMLTGYSVEKNLLEIRKTADDLTVQLIDDLLAYGAAASVYKGNQTMTGTSYTENSSNREISVSEVDWFEIDSNFPLVEQYTVKFGTTLSIKIKVSMMASGLDVQVNEHPYFLSQEDYDNGYIIFESDFISATDFDKDFFVIVHNGEGETYSYIKVSVNDYLYAISQSTDASDEMKTLAKALYNYGVSAKAYHNAVNGAGENTSSTQP